MIASEHPHSFARTRSWCLVAGKSTPASMARMAVHSASFMSAPVPRTAGSHTRAHQAFEPESEPAADNEGAGTGCVAFGRRLVGRRSASAVGGTSGAVNRQDAGCRMGCTLPSATISATRARSWSLRNGLVTYRTAPAGQSSGRVTFTGPSGQKDHRTWRARQLAAAMVEAGRVEEKLRALIGRIGSWFSRVESVRQVRKYIRVDERPAPQGLLDAGRVRRRPHAGPDATSTGTRVVEHLRGDARGAGLRRGASGRPARGWRCWCWDESGQEKSGTTTTGSSGSMSAVLARWPTRSTHRRVRMDPDGRAKPVGGSCQGSTSGGRSGTDW